MALSDRLELAWKPNVESCTKVAPDCPYKDFVLASFDRTSPRPRGRDNPAMDHQQIAGAAVEAEFSRIVASITDGDTFRCTDGTRVRIAGINAREKDGSCNIRVPCPDASPGEATAALSALASGQVLQCQPNGTTCNWIAAFCRRRSVLRHAEQPDGRAVGSALAGTCVSYGRLALPARFRGENRARSPRSRSGDLQPMPT